MNQLDGELRATVAYVGTGDGGAAANVHALAQFVYPEPEVADAEPPVRLCLLLTAPWSGEPLRVTVEGWDRVPADAASQARLAAASAVVFVADSDPARLAAARDALGDLERALAARGVALAELPHVVQYNNRDLRGVLPVRELREALNLHGADEVEAATARGRGALTTLVVALHALSPRRSRNPRPPR